MLANDASTDGTRGIAVACGARVIEVEHRHIAATRNAGARATGGEFLFFVDADTQVSTDVIAQALDELRGGAVGGGATVRFDGPMPWHFRPIIRATVAASRLTRLAFGCFVFCRRDAFDAVGGFDEGLYASEEIAFSRAMKRRGRFVILRAEVLTSGRKLRAHSAREVWRGLAHATRQMLGLGKGRHGLDAWYGQRRQDPWREPLDRG